MPDTASTCIDSRYDLLEQLGKGGMGIVYKAHDRLTDNEVALKLVNNAHPTSIISTGSTDDMQLALAREFRTLASLRHPHIVAVLDYGFDVQQRSYYTMQLLEDAQTLTEYAAPLSIEKKVLACVDVLHALVYLHRRGIIHRDLKPANVLVNASRTIRVVDFGIALEPGLLTQSDEFTGIAGTLPYMAPELFADEPASIASDLYALGVILYEILTGQHPFVAKQSAGLMMKIISQQPDLESLPKIVQGIVGRLLAKRPEERYESAQQTIEALLSSIDIPYPEETETIRESFLQASRFVGRQEEFNRLKDALHASLGGESSIWLVGGESGVGKSRLLEELRSYALVKGASVFRGQAVAEGGLPYQMWRDIVRKLCINVEVAEQEAAILKPLVPGIEKLLGNKQLPDAPELSGRAGERRLVLTIVDLIKRSDRPVVILLEDLQWADESLAPIQHLLKTLDQVAGLLVIGSYRDDERPSLLDELNGVQVLTLQRLDSAALAELTYAMLGETGQHPQLLDFLDREAEGNIFFIIEILRALSENAGGLSAITTAKLPETILSGGMQEIIQRRLSQIPIEYRELLDIAAVSGRQLDLNLLRRFADDTIIDGFITAGSNASVFDIVDSTWRFSHDKLREGLIAVLSTQRLRQLHQHIAKAIEAIYPDDSAYDELLLEHWQKAGFPEHELKHLMPVVHDLVNIKAEYQRADELIQRGLSLLDEGDSRVLRLLNIRSTAYRYMGELDLAAQYAQDAQKLATRFDIPTELAKSYVNLGNIATTKGNHEEAERFYRKSLELKRAIDDQYGVAIALHNLGTVISEYGDQEEAAALYEQSLAIKREIGDQRGIANSLLNLGALAYEQGNLVKALDLFEQSQRLFKEIGDRYALGAILNNLGFIAEEQEDFENAFRYYEQSLSIKEQIGDQYGVVATSLALGNLAHLNQQYSIAEQHYLKSLATARKLEKDHAMLDALYSLSILYAMQNLPQSFATLQEALLLRKNHALSHNDYMALIAMTWIYIQIEDYQQAAEVSALARAQLETVGSAEQRFLTHLNTVLSTQLNDKLLEQTVRQASKADIAATVATFLKLLPTLAENYPEVDDKAKAPDALPFERGAQTTMSVVTTLLKAVESHQAEGDLQETLKIFGAVEAYVASAAGVVLDEATANQIKTMRLELEDQHGTEVLQRYTKDASTLDIENYTTQFIEKYDGENEN